MWRRVHQPPLSTFEGVEVYSGAAEEMGWRWLEEVLPTDAPDLEPLEGRE